MYESRFIDGALRPLIRVTEFLWIQNTVMMEILDSIPGTDWKKEMINRVTTTAVDRTKFEAIYESLNDPDKLHIAIQELLAIRQTF